MSLTSSMPELIAGKAALLVDGDNLSASHAARLLQLCQSIGEPTVRRVYGRAAQVADWENHGFRIVAATGAKNSADLALSVDAMTLALREAFPTLVIASSDRDFTPVAVQLRELGFLVIGVGEQKSGPSLRHAYSHFVELPPVKVAASPSVAPKAAADRDATPPRISTVDAKVLDICREYGDSTGSIALGQLGNLLKRRGIDRTDIPGWTWQGYFRQHPRFSVQGSGSGLTVRPA